MTGPVQPVRLPATIGERWVSLPLLWLRHGTWRVWLVDGATSLAFDARQVVAHLGIVDESVYVEFPVDWWHEYFDPRRPEPITLALWSHETVLRVAERFTPAGSRELMEFTSWVSAQFHGLCLEDPQRTLDESLPA
ncbi:MAG: hypothetical protein KKF42_03895, partial [Actinobacteria bacterium]|nr:hypothetical protein [Actinomycetota bacterium]